MAVAIAGGIGVFAGTIVSAATTLLAGRLTRGHERDRWKRDKLLEAYANFGTAFNQVQDAYRYRRTDQLLPKLNVALFELAGRREQVVLLAPKDTSEKADQVTTAAQILFANLTGAVGNPSHAELSMQKAWDVHKELVELQQRDLRDTNLGGMRSTLRSRWQVHDRTP